MPQARAPQPAAEPAPTTQEGSRWIGGRPSGEDVAAWFKANVKLHEGLKAEDYVTGLTLISGKEKVRVAKVIQEQEVIVEEERLVHTPYAKVETRVAYFWDLMALKPEWVGVIEPAPIVGGSPEGLPHGFFRMQILKPDGKTVNFVCCSMRVRILKADTVQPAEFKPEAESAHPRFRQVQRFLHFEAIQGTPVAVYPAATKMIATTSRNGDEDPFALMKAETGAVGRALGMAGMLVIPGSGVATAEDMLEAQAGAGGGAVDPQLETAAQQPPAEAGPTDLRAEIEAMVLQLEAEKPDKLEEVRAWATERKVVLANLTDTQLRGVHRKLKDALEASD